MYATADLQSAFVKQSRLTAVEAVGPFLTENAGAATGLKNEEARAEDAGAVLAQNFWGKGGRVHRVLEKSLKVLEF